MRIEQLARPAVASLPVYEPGKPVELVARDLGLDPSAIVKLASNENPLGPPPAAVRALAAAAGEVHRYPDNACWRLRQMLAERLGVPGAQLVFGAGSNELINLVATVFLGPGREAVMGRGAFISYRIATLQAGAAPIEVPLRDFTHDLEAMRAAITPQTGVVFLPSPNNPTGTANPAADVEAFARDLPPHVVLCFDAAYAEYHDDGPDLRPFIAAGRPVLVLRTFSKIYGLSGLRVGYGFAPEPLIALLERVRPPFNVSVPAQVAAEAALTETDWVERSRAANAAGLRQVTAGLEALGFPVVPSRGNFVLAEFGDGAAWNAALLRNGVIVRPVGGYGFGGHLRLSIGTEAENARLLEVLTSLRRTGELAQTARQT